MLLDDFFADYWAREDTLEEVWRWVLGRTHGHLHLAGPAGCGKTWIQRGLANGAQERGALPLYLERAPEESFTLLVWRLVDAAEFVLDVDGEALRLAVSQAFYEHGAPEAMLAAVQWLTQEVEGSFLILLDGIDEPEHLRELPDWRSLPEGVYIVTSGRARAAQREVERDQLALRADHPRNLGDMEGYLLKVLPDESQSFAGEIVRRSGGNWRFAYYCRVLLRLRVRHIPEPTELFPALLEAIAQKAGEELFRTVHLEALLLLAIAQVPASLELLRSWGIPQDSLGFALFDLRDLLYTDGEGSQYDALFTGEHYSLRSDDLRGYLLENPAWRDRVSDCHRRVVQMALQPARLHNPNGPVEDGDFYSLAFAQHHLSVSGRRADLERFQEDPETVERCWNLGRAAREQGYDEIGLQLFLVAAQLLEKRQAGRSKRSLGQLAEVYADCCHALTNQGRYSDGAQFGERAVDMLRPLGDGSPGDPVDSLLTHCLLCLADPYLYMGYVHKAQPLYNEALDRAAREPGVDQSKVIHALRGLARSWRAQDRIDDSLRRGQEALDLARKLTREEGEDWAQYLFELLMEQAETLRLARETLPEGTGPLEQMSLRWEVLRNLREAEDLYGKFGWPPDQELVFLYLEQSMALFDLERWAEAEERLTRAIEVINSLPASDSHPADIASLEFLRSHALALMNRIGEASGSLNNLLNPELMGEMDTSEQALVLFFRAKILSHQGLLRQAEAALTESIAFYAQTIALGADDLALEHISAKIYLARVIGRRGRLEEALQLCRECQAELQAQDSEEEDLPLLEMADAGELQAWVLLQREQFEEALDACNTAALALDQIRTGEVEADVETEHSLNQVTRGLIFSGMGHHADAIAAAEQAVDLESRRAQEGYEQARMWVALHRLALARIFRKAGRAEDALAIAQQAYDELDAMPGNQKNHLGLHLAAAQAEVALAALYLERWDSVRGPLGMAIGQYENEMWQGKEYLVSLLLECNRSWLDFLRRSNAPEWNDRSAWDTFFQGWNRWQAQIREEADNFFVQLAQKRLRAWVESLPETLQKEWDTAAPQGLRRNSAARQTKEGP